MEVTLNSRGRVFLVVTILLTLSAVLVRVPPLGLISMMFVSYVIAFPFYKRKLIKPDVRFKAKLRHNVIYRGEVEILHISIENRSQLYLPLVWIKLNLPSYVMPVKRNDNIRLTLKPDQKILINIPLLATVRGEYQIGPIQAMITDPFQIYEILLGEVSHINMKVYPKRLGSQVSKTKAKQVFNKIIGFFAMNMRGLGTDFHGLREYIRGDPSKIVDWKATARSNKLISREFEDEKKLDVLICVASGSSMKGNKFDFVTGMAMDLYEGFVQEGKPVGLVIFEDQIIREFLPSQSQKRVAKIWASIYDIVPSDVYTDYTILDKWVDKNGITNTLIIVLGDLDYEFERISDAIRNMKLRGNYLLFIDVWGFGFTMKNELEDAVINSGFDQYGEFLREVIGRSIEQANILRGLEVRQSLTKGGVIYAYIKGPKDNVINSLDRAMFRFYGKKWKAMG